MGCIQMNIMWLLIVLVPLAFLVLGIKGVVEKKPFLISSRWMWVIMLFLFAPLIFYSLFNIMDGGYFWLFILFSLMFIAPLFFMWRAMCGYTAFGVTNDSFRDAIHAALSVRSLAYEERLTEIFLKDDEVDLNVAVQNRIGTGMVRIKEGHKETLRAIVAEMNKYFCDNKVAANLFLCKMFIVLGLMMLIWGIGGWVHIIGKC